MVQAARPGVERHYPWDLFSDPRVQFADLRDEFAGLRDYFSRLREENDNRLDGFHKLRDGFGKLRDVGHPKGMFFANSGKRLTFAWIEIRNLRKSFSKGWSRFPN